MLAGKIIITGGTGTLGQAIVKRAALEHWPCSFTIFSRDPLKQQAMRRQWPQHHYVIGDILDPRGLELAIAGHDIVIHAAAQKHIPEAEAWPLDTYRTNVDGSTNVLMAALRLGVLRVIGISTDKACHPVNAYGCSKLMMERVWQALSDAERAQTTQVTLCRYGNVLGSNGSVLQVWARQAAEKQPLRITDPSMTRFWLAPSAAVALIVAAAGQPSGTILIPRLKALSMRSLAQFTHPGAELLTMGLRPGEKLHEEMLTPEESPFADEVDGYIRLWPVTRHHCSGGTTGYQSDQVDVLPRWELASMLEEVA